MRSTAAKLWVPRAGSKKRVSGLRSSTAPVCHHKTTLPVTTPSSRETSTSRVRTASAMATTAGKSARSPRSST